MTTWTPAAEELTICAKSPARRRQNGPDLTTTYLDHVFDKPWGKEYLVYQNNMIGVWILHVNEGAETSVHCHFKKDTVLIGLQGACRINRMENDRFHIIHALDTLYIPRECFHGIHAYTDSVIMEIEIYTEGISYSDKNDLLRLRDIHGRNKNTYEGSAKQRVPRPKERVVLAAETCCIDDTEISVITLEEDNYTAVIPGDYQTMFLLEGSIYQNGRLEPGSQVYPDRTISLLSYGAKLLCFRNLYHPYLQKLIYSKDHLRDQLAQLALSVRSDQSDQVGQQSRIGLTSGCFDIMHTGHLRTLKISRRLCDRLYVCLSSDKQIRHLKGSDRPINSLKDRIAMLLHMDFVDHLVLYDEVDYANESELDAIMNIIDPHTWFKGTDYTVSGIYAKHPSLRNVHLIPLEAGKSTTNIIAQIRTGHTRPG